MSHFIKSFLWNNKLVFMDFGEFYIIPILAGLGEWIFNAAPSSQYYQISNGSIDYV